MPESAKTANREPQYVEKYRFGIDPTKRTEHRGFLRMFQFIDGTSLSDITKYVAYEKRQNPGVQIATRSAHYPEKDGYTYSYLDEFVRTVPSLVEAAHILNRNRSTLSSYLKNPSFPAELDEESWSVDIIAAQDWILWNTEHHFGLEPYWPEIKDDTKALLAFPSERAGDLDEDVHIYRLEEDEQSAA